MKKRLKKVLLYLLVIVLYAFIPVIGLGLLGTGVSMRYEVIESRTFMEIDRQEYSAEAFEKEMQKIEDHEAEILYVQKLLFATACILFLSATTLLIRRKRILN